MKRSEILVVCEGNICRSPLGALVLKDRLADTIGINVVSAGLRAVVGAGMDAQASRQAERLSLDPSSHIARRLTEDMIDRAALVLTMTVEQRTRVVQLSPLAMRRTFTFKEFAIVAQDAPNQSGSGVELLQAVAAWGNSTRSSQSADELDIDDPYRRDESVHARVADEIHDAAQAIVWRIRSI